MLPISHLSIFNWFALGQKNLKSLPNLCTSTKSGTVTNILYYKGVDEQGLYEILMHSITIVIYEGGGGGLIAFIYIFLCGGGGKHIYKFNYGIFESYTIVWLCVLNDNTWKA